MTASLVDHARAPRTHPDPMIGIADIGRIPSGSPPVTWRTEEPERPSAGGRGRHGDRRNPDIEPAWAGPRGGVGAHRTGRTDKRRHKRFRPGSARPRAPRPRRGGGLPTAPTPTGRRSSRSRDRTNYGDGRRRQSRGRRRRLPDQADQTCRAARTDPRTPPPRGPDHHGQHDPHTGRPGRRLRRPASDGGGRRGRSAAARVRSARPTRSRTRRRHLTDHADVGRVGRALGTAPPSARRTRGSRSPQTGAARRAGTAAFLPEIATVREHGYRLELSIGR